LHRIPRPLHQKEGIGKDDLHEEAVKLYCNIGKAFIYVWIAIYILGFISGAERVFLELGEVSILPGKVSILYRSLAFSCIIVLGFISLIIAYTCTSKYFRPRFKRLEIAKRNLQNMMKKKQT
jgi:hypothetical protein